MAPKATHSSRAIGNAAATMLLPAPAHNCPKMPSRGTDLSPSAAEPLEGYTARPGTRSQPVTRQDWVTSQSFPFDCAHPPQPLLTPKPSRAATPPAPPSTAKAPGDPQPMFPLPPAVLRRGQEVTALTWSWPGRRWRSGGSCLAARPPWAILWRWHLSRRCPHRPWP